MAVSLSKLVNGNPAVTDALGNAQTIPCPQCEQTYRLAYTDSEWNKVKDWLRLAESALRRDHKTRHETAAIPLEWPRVSRKR